MFSWTAKPMTAQGPRKGEPSLPSMRNGLRPQPARSVRGSSRRIMSMRFRPANIRVINRRVCSLAVIGPAVPTKALQAHQQERVPTCAAHRRSRQMPERCSPSRVRFAAPKAGAPLLVARRSGQQLMRRAAPTGTLQDPRGPPERGKADSPPCGGKPA